MNEIPFTCETQALGRYLVFYDTTTGQSQKIANKIAQELQSVSSLKAELYPVGALCAHQPNKTDTVVLVAPVRRGKLSREFCAVVEKHTERLNASFSVFSLVALSARTTDIRKVKDNSDPRKNTYVVRFLSRVSWKPRLVSVFAGALRYSQYDLFSRLMIRFIMKITGGPTDLSTNIEYTDWKQVDAFACKVHEESIKRLSQMTGC